MAQLDVCPTEDEEVAGSTPLGGQHSFMEIDHEISSTGILSLLLIQEEQLSLSDERINTQDKIFRSKRLSTCATFVHVYLEIWDKGILKFNKFSM